MKRHMRSWCISLVVLIIPVCIRAEESLTITTYYPSPQGVYNTLKAKRVAVGATYYSQGWTDQGGVINETNNVDLVVEGRVGIGTNDPYASLLHVPGIVLLGGRSATPYNLESELLRIRSQESYFDVNGDGTPDLDGEALFLEKTDDDSSVEGGMIFGFAKSAAADTFIRSPGWAVTSQPVMTLRGSGNVGIGTIEPNATLDVNSTGSGSNILKLSMIEPGADRSWVFRHNLTGPSTGLELHALAGDKNFNITSNTGNVTAQFFASSTGADRVYFFPGGTAGAGRVGIGATTLTYPLHVKGNLQGQIHLSESTSNKGWRIGSEQTTGAFIVYNDNSYGAYLGWNGETWQTCHSDIRVKTDIKPLEDVLKNMLELRPVWYRLKKSSSPKLTLGFIAQDVEKVFPSLVYDSPIVEEEGIRYKTLSYQDFILLSVKAIQELKQEKDTEVALLQSRLKDLEDRLDRLEAKK